MLGDELKHFKTHNTKRKLKDKAQTLKSTENLTRLGFSDLP
jgi:hypothetical protein